MTKVTIGYFILLTFHLMGISLAYAPLSATTKPLLMPYLIVLVWNHKGGIKSRWILFLALLFSWIGDLFLMLSGEQHFIFGLAAFFCAQVCYIRLFLMTSSWRPLFFLPFLCFAALLLGGPLDGKIPPPLQLPLYAYTGVICLMGYTASLRQPLLPGYAAVLIGAILFILSDSFIALNRFGGGVQGADLWIMFSYGLAQYLIASGWLKQSS